MLLDARTRPEDLREPGLRRCEDDRFLIAWKGHLYVPGETAGAESAARLAAKLRREGLETTAHRLSGVFGLFVHDKERGGWEITADNAGCYKIYRDSKGVGTGFLGLGRGGRLPGGRACA